VEVVVLDRLGQAVIRQLAALRLDAGSECSQAASLILRESLESLGVCEHLFELARKRSEQPIGDAGRQKSVPVGRHVHLQLGVERQDLYPDVEIAGLLQDLPQARSTVALQHPAALQVGREEDGHQVGATPGQRLDDSDFEGLCGHIRLEPDVSIVGRYAKNRRPRADVRLLDLSGGLQAEPLELRANPGMDGLEPVPLGPEQSVSQDVSSGGF
jgi:hypothetical protein